MNLKVNNDGKGGSKENIDFINGIRNEFYSINYQTAGVIMAATFMVAQMRGDLKQDVVTSVFMWNAAGNSINALVSLGAG